MIRNTLFLSLVEVNYYFRCSHIFCCFFQATCPSKWGSMNDSKPMAASSSYKVAVIINQLLPCTGHIRQWHVKADKKDDVRLCIVRPNPKKSNTFTVICNTTFTAVKGINKIKTSKCCMFQKGDMVAYIAILGVLLRHATSSPVTIFHLFELNGDVLEPIGGLKNIQDTAGHYDIVLEIEGTLENRFTIQFSQFTS